MLKISEITKRYSGNIALELNRFEVSSGAILGIIGPNGAGKSTLLDIITGFMEPDRGRVVFRDRELRSFDEKKQIFSYMPENVTIYPDFYVGEFIEFVHSMAGGLTAEFADALNLKKESHKKIVALSKGYHQRLKLLFALANTKEIVVLDEPFDGFDPIQLMDILELIKEENRKGRTFILSIHQLYDAEKICSHYVLLDEGRMVAEGSAEKLKQLYGKASNLEEIFVRALK